MIVVGWLREREDKEVNGMGWDLVRWKEETGLHGGYNL